MGKPLKLGHAFRKWSGLEWNPRLFHPPACGLSTGQDALPDGFHTTEYVHKLQLQVHARNQEGREINFIESLFTISLYYFKYFKVESGNTFNSQHRV